MPKSKDTHRERRPKHAPREPSREREEAWRPADDQLESDGTVESELDEVDTDKFQAPRKR